MTHAASLLSRLVSIAAMLALVVALPWLGGDPAYRLLRAGSAEREATPDQLAAISAELGLDGGPIAYGWAWVRGVLGGDLGTSWVSGAPITPGVLGATAVSLTLVAAALLVAGATCIALVVGPLLRGSAGRPITSSGSVASALVAIPEYVLATGLLLVLAIAWRLLPPYGWTEPRHLVMPALALGLPAGGLLARLLLDALREVFTEPWVASWRAVDLGRRRIALGALRRSTPALVPQVGLVVAALAGGAVVVEEVFAVPGLGRLALGSALAGDLPILQAAILVLLVLGVVTGVSTEAVRRLLLGPAAAEGALPATSARPPAVGPLVPALVLGCVVVVVAAGLARDPIALDLGARLSPPSLAAPLGTDSLGRDVLARVGHGAGRTLALAALVSGLSLAIAVLAGLAPTLSRGAAESLNALPPVIAGIVTAALLGPGEVGAALAVLAVSWMGPARHVAALVEEARAATFLQASRALGASPWRLATREILPLVLPPVTRHVLVRLPGVALALAALGFLGLGAQPPTPEWGRVLAEGMPYAERAPWTVLAPALLLAAVGVLATHPGTPGILTHSTAALRRLAHPPASTRSRADSHPDTDGVAMTTPLLSSSMSASTSAKSSSESTASEVAARSSGRWSCHEGFPADESVAADRLPDDAGVSCRGASTARAHAPFREGGRRWPHPPSRTPVDPPDPPGAATPPPVTPVRPADDPGREHSPG